MSSTPSEATFSRFRWDLWGEGIIRVLIVEDRDAFAGFLRVVAAGCGYEPRILQLRERFEDVVSDWNPDIVVLDILMPERDGIELIGALAEAAYGGQLILVSGAEEFYLTMAAKHARDRGLALSATLRKPCRAEELRQTLRKAGASVLKQNGDEGESAKAQIIRPHGQQGLSQSD